MFMHIHIDTGKHIYMYLLQVLDYVKLPAYLLKRNLRS